jgi:transposase
MIGYDGNKKIKGRKRLLAVDILGLLHSVIVQSAKDHDTKIGLLFMKKIGKTFPRLQKIIADEGFTSDDLRTKTTINTAAFLEIKKGIKDSSVKGFKVIPKRWIVERNNAWNIFQRRLSKDFEHNPKTSETLIILTAIKRNLRLLLL